MERKFKSKGSNVKKNWFWHSLAIGICFIFLLCRNSKFKIFICFFDFIEIMNSLLESFEKKVQQPCFYSFMQFSMCISLLFDLLTQVTTKIILIFFSLKTSFWCNVFFETCFFFSQNNVIWDLNCLFMMPKRCFFFTLNYIWFRKYHWQIRPSKKIEHLNISMPHFQKGHEIKFFLGQTYFLLYDLLCYYHQTAWLHSDLYKKIL